MLLENLITGEKQNLNSIKINKYRSNGKRIIDGKNRKKLSILYNIHEDAFVRIITSRSE